jgi:hypothetical protein
MKTSAMAAARSVSSPFAREPGGEDNEIREVDIGRSGAGIDGTQFVTIPGKSEATIARPDLENHPGQAEAAKGVVAGPLSKAGVCLAFVLNGALE